MCLYSDQSAADDAGDAADSFPGAAEEHVGTVTRKRH